MIFKKNIFIFVILFSPAILAEEAINNEKIHRCHVPEEPNILIGNTISEEELIAIQGIVKKYLAQGEQYLSCIAQVEKNLGEDATDENKYLIASLHNKLVDQMESVASLFNSAVRAYKEKRQDREIVNIDKVASSPKSLLTRETIKNLFSSTAIANRQKKERSKKRIDDIYSADLRTEPAKFSMDRREMRADLARMRKEMKDISGKESGDTSSKSIEERLATLDQLYEKELITKEEYIYTRNIILDEI